MKRDYYILRCQNFQGVGPTVGTTHTLSYGDSQWPEQVTFNMSKISSLLLEINPLKKPSGVIMFVSRVASPRILDAVWQNDDLRHPIRIRTGDYWVVKTRCNSTGCPRIRFKITRGSLSITILSRQSKFF